MLPTPPCSSSPTSPYEGHSPAPEAGDGYITVKEIWDTFTTFDIAICSMSAFLILIWIILLKRKNYIRVKYVIFNIIFIICFITGLYLENVYLFFDYYLGIKPGTDCADRAVFRMSPIWLIQGKFWPSDNKHRVLSVVVALVVIIFQIQQLLFLDIFTVFRKLTDYINKKCSHKCIFIFSNIMDFLAKFTLSMLFCFIIYTIGIYQVKKVWDKKLKYHQFTVYIWMGIHYGCTIIILCVIILILYSLIIKYYHIKWYNIKNQFMKYSCKNRIVYNVYSLQVLILLIGSLYSLIWLMLDKNIFMEIVYEDYTGTYPILFRDYDRFYTLYTISTEFITRTYQAHVGVYFLNYVYVIFVIIIPFIQNIGLIILILLKQTKLKKHISVMRFEKVLWIFCLYNCIDVFLFTCLIEYIYIHDITNYVFNHVWVTIDYINYCEDVFSVDECQQAGVEIIFHNGLYYLIYVWISLSISSIFVIFLNKYHTESMNHNCVPDNKIEDQQSMIKADASNISIQRGIKNLNAPDLEQMFINKLHTQSMNGNYVSDNDIEDQQSMNKADTSNTSIQRGMKNSNTPDLEDYKSLM